MLSIFIESSESIVLIEIINKFVVLIDKIYTSMTPRQTNNKKGKGKAVMNGKETGIPFTSTYQPTPEQKQAGKQRKKLLKDILNAALNPKGEHAEMIIKCAAYLEKDPADITLAEIMHFRQAQKAIQKQDTFAYQAVMDRAFGKPESKTTLANDENNPITPLSGDQVAELLAQIKAGKK